MGKEQLSRIEFDTMDLASRVSARALEHNEPAHNTLPFPCVRICMHATRASEDWSAPSAMAYSMACSMAHAGHSKRSSDSNSNSDGAAGMQYQQRQQRRHSGSSSVT